MRKLAVIHHRHQDWVPALQKAEPRLDIQGWHPRDWKQADQAWLAEAEALFCWALPEGLVTGMPALSWIQNSGAGVDHLMHHSELPTHIPITRADGGFGFWMARYVLGHLLYGAQNVEACRAAQNLSNWNPKLLPESLTGQRALILGHGRIGRCIGLALRSIGMEVQFFARHAGLVAGEGITTPADLPHYLSDARVLALAVPLTDETRGMIDSKLLAHGNPRLEFFNVGRGELMDVSAILQALDENRLARAVLDVFPIEPLPKDSPLWLHPKVIITPHHSGPSTPRELIPDILENLRNFAEGKPIQNTVDRTRGY
jgi:glyoxylate/hydroxypyruvate reductase